MAKIVKVVWDDSFNAYICHVSECISTDFDENGRFSVYCGNCPYSEIISDSDLRQYFEASSEV